MVRSLATNRELNQNPEYLAALMRWEFGGDIRQLRELYSLTPENCAKSLKISSQQLNDMELGDCSYPLATYLGIKHALMAQLAG